MRPDSDACADGKLQISRAPPTPPPLIAGVTKTRNNRDSRAVARNTSNATAPSSAALNVHAPQPPAAKMMSKAKARTAAAAASAKAAASQLELPPQLAPPAFGGPDEGASDDLPAGWESATSRSTGEGYYVNSATGESQYDRPTAPTDDEADGGGRRESLKARAAQAKATASKAAAATKTATKSLSSLETVGAVRGELRDAKQRAAQSSPAKAAQSAAASAAAFKAVLPVLTFGEDSDEEYEDDGFGEQDLDEAQSALEEMSRQVSSRLVDMTELLDEEKELRQEAEVESMILRQELEALWSATRTTAPAGAAPEEVAPVPAARAASPEPEEALPSPVPSEATTSDEPVEAEERRTYAPSDEELREAVVALRAETEGMGMGKMRKAMQSRRKWAVSEKRLRTMIRAIETGVEVDKTEDERVETVEMLSSTCMELQGTVQRQKKQLQKQRKQLADAREQMIQLQKYADAMKAENEALKGAYIYESMQMKILS